MGPGSSAVDSFTIDVKPFPWNEGVVQLHVACNYF